jgi:hypothetical protein
MQMHSLPNLEWRIAAPSGYALAARPRFMLFGHVAFPKQNSRVLAVGTEILAQRAQELAFLKPADPTNSERSL